MSQITTHVLDTAKGSPAENVPLELSFLDNGVWVPLATGITNNDGRAPDFCPMNNLIAGTYRMVFKLEAYFQSQNQPVFYPWAEVIFNLDGWGTHYHIPLLISPFGYSTYRGS